MYQRRPDSKVLATGILDAVYGAAPMFNLTAADLDPERPTSSTDTGTRFIWDVLMKLSGSGGMSDMIEQLGAELLASQSLLSSGTQNPLPLNQWQLDVTNWWYTVLAAVQIEYVQTAVGTTDLEIRQVSWVPMNDRERKLCNSQVSSSRDVSRSVTCKLVHIFLF